MTAMPEWVAELWARERMEGMRNFASRQALRRTLRPPQRPLRIALGMALIRVGGWLLPRTPESGPSRTR